VRNQSLPIIIQGGMGVNISGWRLAREISRLGHQGTVSGVALQIIVSRLLQRGDPGGHIRRALSRFPFQDVASRVLGEYFVEGGIPDGVPFKRVPKFTVNSSRLLIELTVCANYAFVWLAKEGHGNGVSINYLEKVAMPHVYAITGAMLAGVDCITMGAGIPMQIPALIDALTEGRPAEYRVPVTGTKITSHTMSFDPKDFFGAKLPSLVRPRFFPIISSNLLASIFMKRLPAGSVSGFVIEEPTAGGHNAPPRKIVRDARGAPLPIYGEKDVVDYSRIADLGLPFWIGGSYASPEKLAWATRMGATGIQAGSIFALSEESDMDPVVKREIRAAGFDGTLSVRTDMRISPTGFPFKVVCLEGTIADGDTYRNRCRICNQGELVELYETRAGTIGYRCAAEPPERFVAKGGKFEETIGRGCLCNGLISTANLGNLEEPPVVTLGDDVRFLRKLMKNGNSSYTAEDAISWLLGQTANTT
jgi:NAD(P)H-dependent flavin oxidoreductase YrpB (nitropropane dioxygenase family)